MKPERSLQLGQQILFRKKLRENLLQNNELKDVFNILKNKHYISKEYLLQTSSILKISFF